jgi:light-regulated signal transduction histidine kinase (bacteriophytochrome)
MSEALPYIYSVKRHGTTLDDCDSEPVHTPGCVQSHGALLALRASDFVVVQVSENSLEILGLAPEAILGRGVATVLGEEATQQLKRFVEHERIERNPLYALTITLPTIAAPLDVVVHTLDGQVLVELEYADPRDDFMMVDYYASVRRTTARLEASTSVRAFCQAFAEEVRRITRLDRVMVYRFHPDDTGEVFAEEKRDDLPPWLGLRYPPHDIPKPAREIFKKIWIRPLPDATAPLAELMPLANPDTGRPLEMTYCALRGPSQMYTEYLRNMGVAASLTLSIHRGGELWGLIAAHHETPTRFGYRMRAACEFLAQFVSLQLKQADEREHLQYRVQIEANHTAALARAAREGGLATMAEHAPSLLDGITAGGIAIHHGNRWWTGGVTPTAPQLEEVAAWLRERSPLATDERVAFATDRLSSELPSAAAYAAVGSGLLAVAVSRSHRNLILWFRPEVEQTVRWGGNPNDAPTIPGPHGPRLTPRRSFELWKEIVRARSAPWHAVEIEAAEKLKFLVMDLVIDRAEHLAELNEELARTNEELNAFAQIASHDLKEPLRGIAKHASYLLEDARVGRALDRRATERVEALLRTTSRMDGLIDALLHFAHVGSNSLAGAPEDLTAVAQEAIEMLGARMIESGAIVRIPRPLPTVECDRVRVREVLSNLISNAIKYTERPEPWIEIGYIGVGESPPEFFVQARCPTSAEGQPIFYVRDNGIGIEPRNFSQIFMMFKRLHPRDAYGGGSGAGLAIVRKLILHHRGSVWVDSTPGAGSVFDFTLAGGSEWS